MGDVVNDNEALLKASATIAILNGLGIVVGLVLDATIAAQFGLGAQTDAFFVASTLPNTAVTLMAMTYTSALVPVLSRKLAAPGDRSDVWRLTSIILNVNLLLGLLVCASGVVGARWVIALVAPGFPEPTAALATELARVLFLAIPLAGIVEINRAILYAHRRFAIPAALNAIRSSVAAGVILLGARHWGITAAAAGLLAGAVAQMTISTVAVSRLCKPSYYFSFDIRHPAVKGSGHLFLAPVAGATFRQVINIATQIIGSFLPEGTIAALSLANRLVFSIGAFLLNSVTKAALPTLSVTCAQKDREGVRRILSASFRLTLLLAMPVAIILIVLGAPLLGLLFQRGAFDRDAVVLTSGILALFALGIPLLGHFRVIQSYFYAALKVRWVVLLFSLQALFTVVLDLILVRFIGAKGLALAFSIGTGAATVVGYLLIRHQRESLSWSSLAVFGAKLLYAALAMALVLWLGTRLQPYVLDARPTVHLVLLSVVMGLGLSVYWIVANLLRVEEICVLRRWLRRSLTFAAKGLITPR